MTCTWPVTNHSGPHLKELLDWPCMDRVRLLHLSIVGCNCKIHHEARAALGEPNLRERLEAAERRDIDTRKALQLGDTENETAMMAAILMQSYRDAAKRAEAAERELKTAGMYRERWESAVKERDEARRLAWVLSLGAPPSPGHSCGPESMCDGVCSDYFYWTQNVNQARAWEPVLAAQEPGE